MTSLMSISPLGTSVVHNVAAFLPWHRYFVSVYEKMLRDECNFNGDMVYWDWTLDWERPDAAEVFEPISGFGGNGNVSGALTVGQARCVVDGPFAGLQLQYFDDTSQKPHCLSRNFNNAVQPGTPGYKEGQLDGAPYRPEVLKKVLAEKTYDGFRAALEDGPHNAIPLGLGGDFAAFTAPNGNHPLPGPIRQLTYFYEDPLFFLHHVQLDRLWWMWQEAALSERLMQYNGMRNVSGVEVPATLDDVLPMTGLSHSATVRDVMDIRNGLLCYTYL
ncbi:tyrosinase central domain containing protein [Colletotrichum tofieldiae]|uniref:Tyrosinase central domain containing protein n=1 Tax=Colletotrichum tofieldiae TaxID=708197 RepID=A0A161W285_9PEZI|nr:tyrosinase central domain containing protein [Colletotrichum tofieldiae]